MTQASSTNIDSTLPPLRIAVVTCAVLELEVQHYMKALPQVVHVEILEQGLHNEPDRLRSELQKTVAAVESKINPDAIVLGYGLCSRGIEGVHTQHAKLIVPRAHDCITLLLGSKERYEQYVKDHPGTYWYSPGWNKHHTPPGKQRYEKLYQKYLQQFGEDDARYLMEQEQHWFTSYSRATYVDLTVGATEADLHYTRDCADWLKWGFDHQRGDPQLLIDLMQGRWNPDEVLVLEPGQTIRMTADQRVMEAVDVK